MTVKIFGSLVTSFFTIFIFCLPYLFLERTTKKIEYLVIFIICLPIFSSLFFNLLNINNNMLQQKNINLKIFQLNKKILDNKKKLENFNEIIKKITNSDAELILFAENNYPYVVEDLDFSKIQQTIKENQIVIIGGTRHERNKYYNSLFNITKNDVLFFDKKILVPFGEFIPFREKLNFFEIISGPSDFEVGRQKRYLDIDNKLSYIPIICYEIIFY